MPFETLASSTEAADEPLQISFPDIPPFPDSVSTAPLLRISLQKLLEAQDAEEEKLWQASRDLGFFYMDLRTIHSGDLTDGTDKDDPKKHTIDGLALLQDVDKLFQVQEEFFKLPVEEKQRYDLKDKGSYFGYKGYGSGFTDRNGTPDRNEFYNISKDDILAQSSPLPAPPVLAPHRPLLSSFIHQSHSLVSLILSILASRLGLPSNSLGSLHRLSAISGDQVRFIRAPPQPIDDRIVSLGEHTDFGSVTILFNRVGGLQVQLPLGIRAVRPDVADGPQQHREQKHDGEWAYVRPLPGHAIINLGDALVKFTAGVLRSNIHRVVSPPEEQASITRYSLVYFARPEDEVILRPLKSASMVEEALRKARMRKDGELEEAVTSKEWILRRGLGSRTAGSWEKSRGTESTAT